MRKEQNLAAEVQIGVSVPWSGTGIAKLRINNNIAKTSNSDTEKTTAVAVEIYDNKKLFVYLILE